VAKKQWWLPFYRWKIKMLLSSGGAASIQKLLLPGVGYVLNASYRKKDNKRQFYLLSFIPVYLHTCVNAVSYKTKEMNIVIQSVNFRAGFALENFVKEKLNKLFKQSRNIENINVILRKEEKGKIENKSCEIRLALPGNDPFVKKNSVNYEKAILEAVDVLQKILRRRKSRMITKRYSGQI
jgi:ribosomal subunit interface protein